MHKKPILVGRILQQFELFPPLVVIGVPTFHETIFCALSKQIPYTQAIYEELRDHIEPVVVTGIESREM